MAFLSSLMQALRQSTERAVAHVRPPGPIKHGGGAPWKQRLGHAHSVYPYSTSASATVNISEYAATIKVSDRPLVNLFRSIVEHAITPVFRGIKTEQLINEEVKSTIRKATNNFCKPTNNYRKPDPSKGIYDYRRPSPLNSLLQHQRLRKTTADVGLRFAPNDGFNCLGMQGPTTNFFSTVMAPSFGLRAAVDELEEQTQNWKRQRSIKKPSIASSSRSSSRRSSLLSKPLNLHQKMIQADSIATCVGLESLLLSNEFDLSDSCSSSYIPETIYRSDSSELAESEFDANEAFTEVVEEPIHIITTLYVPISPDIFRLLAGPLPMEVGTVADELNYRNLIQAEAEVFRRHRLSIILPLEHSLQDGHLSQLGPVGWNAGRLEWASRRLAYLPVTFNNRTRDEVLEMLRYDLDPGIHGIFDAYLVEETIIQPRNAEQLAVQDILIYPNPQADFPKEIMTDQEQAVVV